MDRTTEVNLIESIERCNSIAERVFTDCQENGFSKMLARGYNILISARNYLETGKPMIGNRTHWFFMESNQCNRQHTTKERTCDTE